MSGIGGGGFFGSGKKETNQKTETVSLGGQQQAQDSTILNALQLGDGATLSVLDQGAIRASLEHADAAGVRAADSLTNALVFADLTGARSASGQRDALTFADLQAERAFNFSDRQGERAFSFSDRAAQRAADAGVNALVFADVTGARAASGQRDALAFADLQAERAFNFSDRQGERAADALGRAADALARGAGTSDTAFAFSDRQAERAFDYSDREAGRAADTVATAFDFSDRAAERAQGAYDRSLDAFGELTSDSVSKSYSAFQDSLAAVRESFAGTRDAQEAATARVAAAYANRAELDGAVNADALLRYVLLGAAVLVGGALFYAKGR